VTRPWGTYQGIHRGASHQVKHIVVNPGATLSYQYHHHRYEHWVVVHGQAEVTIDGKVSRLGANQGTFIPLGAKHRLHNPGREPLQLIEVQYGCYTGEDDIVRIDDVYGRVEKSQVAANR
jgi:mannose-1-phosphate guanylyltransferase/mannose-6-phosphate isomerase